MTKKDLLKLIIEADYAELADLLVWYDMKRPGKLDEALEYCASLYSIGGSEMVFNCIGNFIGTDVASTAQHFAPHLLDFLK